MTYESSIKAHYTKWAEERLVQGDLIGGLSFSVGIFSEDKLVGEQFNLKYAIVLTQDCDLNSHHRAIQEGEEGDRAILQTVLICPAYAYAQFKEGTHIEEKFIQKLTNSSKEIKPNNKLKRFHFLEESPEHKVTELIVDFKDFYTVPYEIVAEAKRLNYIATVNELYREHLSQRFANFMSRIGLPDEIA